MTHRTQHDDFAQTTDAVSSLRHQTTGSAEPTHFASRPMSTSTPTPEQPIIPSTGPWLDAQQLGVDPRPKPRWWTHLWFFLTLRPYGNDLLTRHGRGYLLAMSLITLLVALAEAFSWGYLASTMSRTSIWIGWLGFGLFVFTLMWFFDRSLMTADLIEAEHAAKFSTQPTSAKTLKNKTWKANLSFVLRIVLAALSLWITAPYVSQLFFSADIENRIAKRYQQSIETYKTDLTNNANSKATALEKQITILNQKVQDEAGGISGTGALGYGARSKLIDRELNDRKTELEKVLNTRDQSITAIDQAYDRKDYDALRAQGILLDMDSPMLRNEIVAEMEKEPAFWQTETAIRIFLGIMAIILFGMKIIQPRALQLYFSSRLQERWNHYCLGRYDAYLPEMDRRQVLMNAHDSVPETFEQIMVDLCAHQLRHAAEEQAKRDAEVAEQRAKEQQRRAEQDALAAADAAHYARLAHEQSQQAQHVLAREHLQNQHASALDDLQTIEDDYRQRHGTRLMQLEKLIAQHEQAAYRITLEFQTHQERSQARRERLALAEQELSDTEALLRQTRLRDDCARLNVLRLIDSLELAVISQKERLAQQRAELLSFELQQKSVDSQVAHENAMLNRYQDEYEQLNAPLIQTHQHRLAIEAQRMQHAGEQGVLPAPYQPISPQELPLIIRQIKQGVS